MDDRDVYYIKVCLHFMRSPASLNIYIKAQKRKAGKIHILKNSSVSNPSEKLPVLLITYFWDRLSAKFQPKSL